MRWCCARDARQSKGSGFLGTLRGDCGRSIRTGACNEPRSFRAACAHQPARLEIALPLKSRAAASVAPEPRRTAPSTSKITMSRTRQRPFPVRTPCDCLIVFICSVAHFPRRGGKPLCCSTRRPALIVSGSGPSSLGAASSQTLVATAIATWVCSLSSLRHSRSSTLRVLSVLLTKSLMRFGDCGVKLKTISLLPQSHLVSPHYVIA